MDGVLGIEPSSVDEGEFRALWRQWRRDSGLDGPTQGPAEEPLFGAALIENSLTGSELFHLNSESLPVDTLRQWHASGGSGIGTGDLDAGFMVEWFDGLLMAVASVPVVGFSFAISR